MTGKDITNYAVAGVLDVLSVFGVPTATAGQIYQDVLAKRAKEGMEVLLSEIRDANFRNIDQNEAISIIARYQRDAMEGVAKNNLRLMARIINGMAEKNELKAPTFLKYAGILSSLTEDEITVLGLMILDRELNHKRDLSYSKMLLEEKAPAQLLRKKYRGREKDIQQALIRTGLVSMSISSSTKEDVEPSRPMYGNKAQEVESEINYTLTALADEIETYINNFEVKDL